MFGLPLGVVVIAVAIALVVLIAVSWVMTPKNGAPKDPNVAWYERFRKENPKYSPKGGDHSL
jgi:hypothetical protein